MSLVAGPSWRLVCERGKGKMVIKMSTKRPVVRGSCWYKTFAGEGV